MPSDSDEDENTTQFNIAIDVENDGAELDIQRIENAVAEKMAIAIEETKELQKRARNKSQARSIMQNLGKRAPKRKQPKNQELTGRRDLKNGLKMRWINSK